MTDWTAGYVADIAYTYGYYPELNPVRMRHAMRHAGLIPPEVTTACELGFGQGLSTAIHACASTVAWYGTDFNPAQAGLAQELARLSGSNAQLFDESFEQFCTRSDLPDFDYIALHGIWSWISDANRRVIVDFIGRKLKVGGVLYISYNCEPGWAAMLPLRRLMAAHSQVMSAPGMPMVDKVGAAIDFVDRLLAADPRFARDNPQVVERFKSLKTMNRNYLAHEYFNQNWDPMDFSTVAGWLAPAKLSYACSAHLLEAIVPLNLTTEQNRLLTDMPDPVLRESLRDFLVNQTFRRDLWVRGPRHAPRIDNLEALGKLRVMLCRQRSEVTLTVKAGIGEASMQPAIYNALLDALADYRPRSIAELEQQLAGTVTTSALLEAVAILAGKGDVAMVQEDDTIATAKPRCDALNAHLIDKARTSADIVYLASPVTGGAVGANRFEQLFLLSRQQGNTTPAEHAGFATAVLQREGTRLVKDDKPVDDLQETLAILTGHATDFEARLGVLKALGIAV